MPHRARAAARYLVGRLGWSLEASRYQVVLHPMPRRNCTRCRGEGGWWVGGPHPEMEACSCWSGRASRSIRLMRSGSDEPPF